MADVPGIARGMGRWVEIHPVTQDKDEMECCRCGALSRPEDMWSAMIAGHKGNILPMLGGFLHCRTCMLTTDATQAWVDANAAS